MIRILFALVSLAATQAALQNPQTYWHMCDASAAVALDDQHFAVADDEGNFLRIYKRGEPEPIREQNLTKFLGAKGGESDLEGAARVGDRIYWISSHGRDKDGNEAPNRQRFFATQIQSNKLEHIGKPCKNLLKDILAEERFAKFGFREASLISPKERGGLNIEGMTARPDGALLIGFRSPVIAGRGLVLPLLNPAKVIAGEKAQFGDVIELDLAGFGIRDIAITGDKFLVLAGSRDGAKTFRLFLWDGRTSKVEFLPGHYFEKLNPEALFRFPSDAPDIFQILSDDGGKKSAGKECKDLKKQERHFRAGELSLPQLRP